MQELHRELSLFTAPTLPRKTSWLQRYYFLSRWATPFLLLGCLCILVLVWEMLPLGWLHLVLVLLPLQGILLHLLVVRVLAHIDVNKRQTHKLVVGEHFLTIFHSTGEIEQFPLARLTQIRWIYSGFHQAFRKKGKYFNGNQNQLVFSFQDSKHSIHFQLVSRRHMRQFRDLLVRWYETGFSLRGIQSDIWSSTTKSLAAYLILSSICLQRACLSRLIMLFNQSTN